MLLGSLDLLLSNPLEFLRVFPVILVTVGVALLLAITIHEFSHALAAYLLGDTTARRLGRLTLNPIRHLDPMGTVLMLLVGFGWGKPVPVNGLALKGGRQGMAAVAAAGPLSNLVAAFLLSLLIRAGLLGLSSPFFFDAPFATGLNGLLSQMVVIIISYNIILAVFNLIPMFPLDGSGVALGLLPANLARGYARLERYGPALLMTVIAIDTFAHMGILSRIVGPVVNYIARLFLNQGIF
ncbi:MAG: site-2 protease family protein [Dehalococcoidia bacterium]|nr:site-2 protease family protein [Dehalococcoidia bacterium]